MQYGVYTKDGVPIDLGSIRGKPRLDDPFYAAVGEAAPGKTLIEGVDEVVPVLPEPADHSGKSEDDLLEELRSLVVASIRNTAIEAVSLSGGLDSAIVATVARPKAVYSSSYSDYDELGYAVEVATTIGAEHTVVRPTYADAEATLPQIVKAVGWPIFPSSAVGCYAVCQQMQQDGIQDVADGTGPDECFGGYVRYLLVCLEQEIGRCAEFQGYRGMLSRFWGPDWETPARRYYDLLRSGGTVDGPVYDFVAAQFAASEGLVEGMTRVDLQLGMRGFLAMTAGCSKAHGIRWHSPLFTDEIASFAMGLPDYLKTSGRAALEGQTATKILLRRVALSLGVPESVVLRTDKQGWVTPIAKWFAGPLKSWADGLRSDLAVRGFAPRSDPSRGQFDQSVFADVCLELWLRWIQSA